MSGIEILGASPQYRIDPAVAAVLFSLTSRGLPPGRSCTRVIRRRIRNFVVSDNCILQITDAAMVVLFGPWRIDLVSYEVLAWMWTLHAARATQLHGSANMVSLTVSFPPPKKAETEPDIAATYCLLSSP